MGRETSQGTRSAWLCERAMNPPAHKSNQVQEKEVQTYGSNCRSCKQQRRGNVEPHVWELVPSTKLSTFGDTRRNSSIKSICRSLSMLHWIFVHAFSWNLEALLLSLLADLILYRTALSLHRWQAREPLCFASPRPPCCQRQHRNVSMFRSRLRLWSCCRGRCY